VDARRRARRGSRCVARAPGSFAEGDLRAAVRARTTGRARVRPVPAAAESAGDRRAHHALVSKLRGDSLGERNRRGLRQHGACARRPPARHELIGQRDDEDRPGRRAHLGAHVRAAGAPRLSRAPTDARRTDARRGDPGHHRAARPGEARSGRRARVGHPDRDGRSLRRLASGEPAWRSGVARRDAIGRFAWLRRYGGATGSGPPTGFITEQGGLLVASSSTVLEPNPGGFWLFEVPTPNGLIDYAPTSGVATETLTASSTDAFSRSRTRRPRRRRCRCRRSWWTSKRRA
jgi:hypothetical protein